MKLLGWLVFTVGFIVGVIGSVANPNEKIMARKDLNFTKEDIANAANVTASSEDAAKVQVQKALAKSTQQELHDKLNEVLSQQDLYNKEAFAKVVLSATSQRYIKRSMELKNAIPEKRQELMEQMKELFPPEELSSSMDMKDCEAKFKDLSASIQQQITNTTDAEELQRLQIKQRSVGKSEELVASIVEREKLLQEVTVCLNRSLLEDVYPEDLVSSRQFPSWMLASLGVLVGLIGLVFIYKGQAQELAALSDSKEDGSKEKKSINVAGTISDVIAGLKQIDVELVDAIQIQRQLEDIQLQKILPFTEQRGVLSYKMGLSQFAAMFSDFSTGERYVNRAWSAIVDGHREECKQSLVIALENFEEALKKL